MCRSEMGGQEALLKWEAEKESGSWRERWGPEKFFSLKKGNVMASVCGAIDGEELMIQEEALFWKQSPYLAEDPVMQVKGLALGL